MDTTTTAPVVNLDASGIADAIAEGMREQFAAHQAFLTEFGAKFEAPQTPAPAPAPAVITSEPIVYGFAGGSNSEFSLIRDTWKVRESRGVQSEEAAAAKHRLDRFNAQLAAGDVDFAKGTLGNIPQLVPTTNRQDLYQGNLDFDTPLWDAVSRSSIADSTPFRLPKFGAATGLSADHVEGTNPTAGDLQMTTQTITPSAISGAYDLTRELAMSSSPQLDTIAWAEMARAYTEQREGKIAALLTAVAAANTGPGANVTVTGSGADLIDALKGQLVAAKFRRGGNRINRVVTEQDAYLALVNAKDDTNRPLLPAIGQTNADGSVSGGVDAVNLAGYVATGAYALTAASYLFAAQSVWAYVSPIQEFRFEEVSGPANIRLAHFSLFAAAVVRDSDIVRVVYTNA